MPDQSIDDKVEKKDSDSGDSLAYDTGVEFGGMASGLTFGTLAYHYLPSVVGSMIGYAASAAAIAAGVTGLGAILGYSLGKALIGGMRPKPEKKEPEKPKGPPGMPMMG